MKVWYLPEEVYDLPHFLGIVAEDMITRAACFNSIPEFSVGLNKWLPVSFFQVVSVGEENDCALPDSPAKLVLQLLQEFLVLPGKASQLKHQ